MKAKKFAVLISAMSLVLAVSTTTVSAYTREFLFNMDTSYSHGSENYNRGYAATKDDNDNKGYVTVTGFNYTVAGRRPTISMWIGPAGTNVMYSDPSSWQSTAPRRELYYRNANAKAGAYLHLIAEQFGSGGADISGRWTP